MHTRIRKEFRRIHANEHARLRFCSAVLMFLAAANTPVGAEQTAHRSEEDKLRAAQDVLDNPNWYRSDPDVHLSGTSPDVQTMEAISRKEQEAASTIIEFDLPLSTKSELLRSTLNIITLLSNT